MSCGTRVPVWELRREQGAKASERHVGYGQPSWSTPRPVGGTGRKKAGLKIDSRDDCPRCSHNVLIIDHDDTRLLSPNPAIGRSPRTILVTGPRPHRQSWTHVTNAAHNTAPTLGKPNPNPTPLCCLAELILAILCAHCILAHPFDHRKRRHRHSAARALQLLPATMASPTSLYQTHGTASPPSLGTLSTIHDVAR